MTINEQILQACRDWAMSVLGLTDNAQVVLAQRGPDSGPAPRPPALVLDLQTIASPVGTVEWAYASGQAVTIGHRTAALVVTGLGEQTTDWLEDLTLRVEEATPFGVCIAALGPILDLSAFRDTGLLPVYSVEFVVNYAVNTSSPAVAALTFPVTVSQNGNP